MTPKVRSVQRQLDFMLQDAQELFVPGTKLTLLVRPPGGVERCMLLTIETDIEPVIETMRALWSRPPS